LQLVVFVITHANWVKKGSLKRFEYVT